MLNKVLQKGIDRNGESYTITGTKRCCTLKCVGKDGLTSFSLSGDFEYVKKYV